MLRLENNVPYVYANESRDFQLLCRLYDAAFGSVKYSTDSLQHASDTTGCNDALLDLLRYKLGIFTSLSCTKDQLRLVLQVFPQIIRKKGSVQGVSYVLNLFHRLFGEGNEAPEFNIYTVANEQQVTIVFPYNLSNTQLLVELLKYVMPAGLFTNMEVVVASRPVSTLKLTDDVQVRPRNKYNSYVVDPTSDIDNTDDFAELFSTVGLTSVVEEQNSTTE